MEEEGSINFKALRAKFQEEALLAQSRTSRPAVAEKPKHLPPHGGHSSSAVSCINIARDGKTQLVPPVLSRDGLRTSGCRRPVSFPPQSQKTSLSLLSGGENTKRPFLRDQQMPLVLPVLPVKTQTTEPPAKKENKLEPEPEREVLPQNKIKKKGLLLPFKSAKPLKVSEENGEEPTHPVPTTRPCSAPCELPSVEPQTAKDEVSPQSDQSATECPLFSPDVTITPSHAETPTDSDSKFMSTLERAKKKFSCRQMLIPTRPKSLHLPDNTCSDRELPSPPTYIESSWADLPVPSPVTLPSLAYISARPFFKATTSAPNLTLQKQLGQAKAEHPSVRTPEPHPPCAPLKKQLPVLRTLGPQPAKPTRPPVVDLGYYRVASISKVSLGTCFKQVPSEESESQHPSSQNSPLDVLQLPDIQMKAAESEALDIAALEPEAFDLVSADIHAPVHFEVTGSKRPQADLSACYPAEANGSCVMQDVNLGSPNIIPLHPDCFPEPINLSEFLEPAVRQRWSQSDEAPVGSFSKSHSDETDLTAAECQSVPEESKLIGHKTWSDGTRTSLYQQERYYETYDSVYEDVDNIKKCMAQRSSEQQGSIKNPYAVNHTMEEQCVNKLARNPWGSASGERAHLAPYHVPRKEPNTADIKEQKKREKQRLEREKKAQKEREKKENEMKKKFKVTGDEEPMYHARVMVASKVRKNDLPVKTGDTVSIIRTTNCPKGKWLARDANLKYGYISVMNVELNIKEMLELGKKAQAAGRGGHTEDNISIGSRSSSHLFKSSSFTDDSEEWACEDDTITSSSEIHSSASQSASVLQTSCVHVSAQHPLSDANLEDLHTQTRYEALQKLAIFFKHNTNESPNLLDDEEATPTNDEPPTFLCAVEEPPYLEKEVDFTDLVFLPPPPMYADNT